MSHAETARAIRAEINRVELALAQIDAFATDDFRAALPPDLLVKAEAAKASADRSVAKLHRIGLKAFKGSGDVTIASGGGGGK